MSGGTFGTCPSCGKLHIYGATCTCGQRTDRPLEAPTAACPDCGHQHTPNGCTGNPTPSDLWAGVSPAACDCASGKP